MDKQRCKDCQNFYQHYIFSDGRWRWTSCGHCAVVRVKKRSPYDLACEHFVQGAPLEEKFITKEYLYKALLQYVLQLDLPPEIMVETEQTEKQRCISTQRKKPSSDEEGGKNSAPSSEGA